MPISPDYPACGLCGPLNRDGVNYHVLYRTVLGALLHPGDFVCHVLAFHYFTENCVIAREPWSSGDGDKKLAAVGSRACICHRQLACFIKLVRRAFSLVSEFIAWAAHPRATGVAALDHEIRDYPMKNCAAVKWAVAALAAHAVFPAAFAFSKVSKVLGGNGGLFFKEPADNLAFSSIKNRIRARLACHELFLSIKSSAVIEACLFFRCCRSFCSC